MTKKKKRRYKYCWDTSVFLAWLNEEDAAPQNDIDIVLQQIYNDACVLIVPVTVDTEIVRAHHTEEQMAAFDGFLARSNVMSVDTTRAIARKAEEIRSRGIQLSPRHEKRNIKTPDATIIATAIIYEADVLHSLEPRHHSLSRSDIVDGLLITPPRDLAGSRALEMGGSE